MRSEEPSGEDMLKMMRESFEKAILYEVENGGGYARAITICLMTIAQELKMIREFISLR